MEDERISSHSVKWRKAPEQGNAAAQYNLGLMYFKGQGVPQDYVEAMKWYRMAAEQGLADAQNNLGGMYAKGWGVPQNYVQAMKVKWFRQAAEQDFADAQYVLGLMYYAGEGVPQDYVLAHMWLNLACAQGDKYDTEHLEFAAEFMTPAQYAEAQKLAREWATTSHAAPDLFQICEAAKYGGYAITRDKRLLARSDAVADIFSTAELFAGLYYSYINSAPWQQNEA